MLWSTEMLQRLSCLRSKTHRNELSRIISTNHAKRHKSTMKTITFLVVQQHIHCLSSLKMVSGCGGICYFDVICCVSSTDRAVLLACKTGLTNQTDVSDYNNAYVSLSGFYIVDKVKYRVIINYPLCNHVYFLHDVSIIKLLFNWLIFVCKWIVSTIYFFSHIN